MTDIDKPVRSGKFTALKSMLGEKPHEKATFILGILIIGSITAVTALIQTGYVILDHRPKLNPLRVAISPLDEPKTLIGSTATQGKVGGHKTIVISISSSTNPMETQEILSGFSEELATAGLISTDDKDASIAVDLTVDQMQWHADEKANDNVGNAVVLLKSRISWKDGHSSLQISCRVQKRGLKEIASDDAKSSAISKMTNALKLIALNEESNNVSPYSEYCY